MRDIIAYTKLDPSCPGYINIRPEADGSVILTIRADPEAQAGEYICGYARDKGQPGRCTPGDERCNNYCNMAPQKGAMQPNPAPCEQVHEGTTATLRLSAAAWQVLWQEIAAAVGRDARPVPPHGSGP